MYIEEERFVSLNKFYGFELVKMINEEKRIAKQIKEGTFNYE